MNIRNRCFSRTALSQTTSPETQSNIANESLIALTNDASGAVLNSFSPVMKTRNRLSPSSFEPAELDCLLATLTGSQMPRLVNEHDEECPLPKELFDTIVTTLNLMKQGATIILTPEDETLTTQAAANQIGVSRQFFIGLLESGEIPFHKVGTHRRVLLKDLLEYDQKRVRDQKERIRKLSQQVSDAGHYDDDFPTTTR